MTIQLTTSIILSGESSAWIILRSDDKLDCNSAIIKISKDQPKSQKVFLELGTFVTDSNGELVFKIFLKQQMIDFSSKT